jgi:4-hydroxyproline epimerase
MKTSPPPRTIAILDSHTAGEPTRCVLSGLPDLGPGTLAERLERMRREHDHLRRAILAEPRGSEVLVGAYLLPPDSPDCAAAVIFFNNAGYLGMCGHGAIGVAVTLAHLGRIVPDTYLGTQRLQTPVGIVDVHLHDAHIVTIDNVPAYRLASGVQLDLPGWDLIGSSGGGSITGDIAWGGNWFFLVENHGQRLALDNASRLTEFTWAIRTELAARGIRGANGAEIDHIELFSAPENAANHSRNFVLCPGKVYDRSPCGTGTSAKLACLIADGKLAPGEAWRQEGILGTVFEGRARPANGPENGPENGLENGPANGIVHPSITGSAYVTAESTLLFDAEDPFRNGIGA